MELSKKRLLFFRLKRRFSMVVSKSKTNQFAPGVNADLTPGFFLPGDCGREKEMGWVAPAAPPRNMDTLLLTELGRPFERLKNG
jgi:hypothetical protein